jgi:hypothetical protein
MHQVKDLIDKKMIFILNYLKWKSYTIPSVVNSLKKRYVADEKHECECVEKIKLWKETFERLLKKYALWIERSTIINAFENKEVDELSLKIILNKLENQFIRIERGMPQIKVHNDSWFEKKRRAFYEAFHFWDSPVKNAKHKFLFYRARAITALSVIRELRDLRDNFYKLDCKSLNAVITQYESWHKDANEKKMQILNQYRNELIWVEKNLIDNYLIYNEKGLLKKFYKKHILNSRTYWVLRREFLD